MTMPLRLHYAPDNASLIVRLALEELALPYTTVLVDRRRQAQRSAAYLRLNPNGTIPVLETPDGALFETAAILLWLTDRSGQEGHRLAPAPSDPERGVFLTWLFWTSNTLHADLRACFYPDRLAGPDPAQQAQLRHRLQVRLGAQIAILEQALQDRPWLAGADQVTLLDLYLPCLIRWCQLYASAPSVADTGKTDRDWFDLTATPNLHALCLKADNRPGTRAAQQAEGLGQTPFSNPIPATPPEGSAT